MVFAVPSTPFAHEVPRGVTVHAYAHVQDGTLSLLVRAPLEAMRDIEFPLRGPGYLEFAKSGAQLRDAAQLWIADAVSLYANGTPVARARLVDARVSLPSDAMFGAGVSWPDVRASFARPLLGDSLDVMWNQLALDVRLEFALPPNADALVIDTRWARLGVHTATVLHVSGIDRTGRERILTYDGDPGRIDLDPRWYQTALQFIGVGFTHILGGIDHLLFLLCLVVPVRRLLPLVGIVTSFTVAHSITLVASALGFAPDAGFFPPLIEVLIAASIVYMALENIVGAKLERRWMMAFGFGLVHGFGFSFALRDSLQFAGGNLVSALAAFNVGVELGQLLVLAVAVPVLALVMRRVPHERAAAIVLSALIGHEAWHWMTARLVTLREFPIGWPVMDRLFVAGLLRVALLALVAIGALWAMSLLIARLRASAARAGVAAVLGFVLLSMVGSHQLRAQSAAPPPMTRSTVDGVYTAKQATQGREVFNGQCLGCHTTAQHSGTLFTARWVGQSVGQLFRYLNGEMPKSAPGSLTEDEYVWVTAYLLRLNGMPAGSSDLPGDPALLDRIRVDTVRGKGAGGAGARDRPAMPTLSQSRFRLHDRQR